MIRYLDRRIVDIESIMERFERVGKPMRAGGKITWKCRCPAHEDRDPSLTVSQTDDGMILIHCFAGCDVSDVLTAVGLTLVDLYPDGPVRESRKPTQEPFNARVANTAIQIASAQIARGERLSDRDVATLRKAWALVRKENAGEGTGKGMQRKKSDRTGARYRKTR